MSRRANRFKAVGVLFVAAMALFAISAASASAHTWTTEKHLAAGASMPITVEASGSTVLKGTVSGLAVELTASKVEGVSSVIEQEGEGVTTGVPRASGQLKYSGLTLQKPTGCGPPTSVTTTALKAELATVAGLTSGTGFKFRPKSGTLFATVTLTGSCALAGTPFKVTVPETSYFCGETEKFGVMLVKQPIRTSEAINKSCGGTLEAGGNPATLTGTALGLAEGGASWGAE